MSRRHIRNILLKEWALLFTDLNSALTVTLVPLLIVGQGILYIWLAVRFGGESMLTTSVFQTALQKLAGAIPGVAQLPGEEQLLVLLLNQFNFFLLLIPTMIAISVATFSIVDEKLSGTLEALLATPVKTWELLLGKALAGAIPALHGQKMPGARKTQPCLSSSPCWLLLAFRSLELCGSLLR